MIGTLEIVIARTPEVTHVPRGEVVYFVLCEANGLVKIGKTMNARQRIENLRAMCPVPLRLIHILPGYGHEELALHAHFADRRAHSEWFRISPAEAKAITRTRLRHLTMAWHEGETMRQLRARKEERAAGTRRRMQRDRDRAAAAMVSHGD